MKNTYNSKDDAQKKGSPPGWASVMAFTKSKVPARLNAKDSTRFSGLMVIFALFASLSGNAQVVTNGGSGLAPAYLSLNAAVTALNAATITSPVVITLALPQTAPAGGYRITAQGDAVNTITFEGSGNTITAGTSAAGALNDAIFKLVGADYVTIQNFTMVEHATGTLTPSASNTMTEWGVALLYASTTNGAQNNTIQGNTISLNRLYRNSCGIYSNATHDETTPGTTATATTTAGSHTGLSILSNTISNVNIGITVVGPTAAADHNQSLTIGGLGFGNTITDFGTNLPLSTPQNVPAGCYAILVKNTANYTISHNTITSSNGGYIGTGTQFKAIYIPTFTNAPIGTLTQIIDYNSISMRPGASILTYVIHVEAGTGSADTSLSISHNDFNNSTFTVPATVGFYCIINRMGNLIENMNSNTFTNLNINTTGNVFFFDHLVARPANAVCNVNNNSIVGTFTKTAGGQLTFYLSSSVSPASVTETFDGNDFSNITLSGAATINGMRCSDGVGSGPVKTVSNNVFTNIIGGTGTITLLQVVGSSSGTTVNNTTISNVSGGGAITGIDGPFNGSQTFENNTIQGLTSSGASSTVTGMSIGGTGVQQVFKNKIYNLEATGTTANVYGINTSGTGTFNIQNNFVGDLRAPNTDGANRIRGINIGTTGGVTDVAHNTVWLSGTSIGAVFGSSAITTNTGAVTLRNNIFVNKTTANGGAFAAAHSRSTTDLTNYTTASNNNLFFGSTLFTDGIVNDVTLADYKARVNPREVLSATEDPPFLSTTGTDADFLHIDTTVPTKTEGRAVVIAGITDDFDGDARNATTPDIGADEFAGIMDCTSTWWTGAVSNAWNTAGNWDCGSAPTPLTDAMIPVVVSGNYPIIDDADGMANSKDINVASGATVTVNGAGDGTLQIAGAITNGGVLNATDGTVIMAGTSAQAIPAAAFATNTLRNLTIDNASGVTLGGATNLTGVLTVTTGAFNTGNALTLKSNASTTAMIAPVTGSVTGTMTVERYIPARRAFRFMSSPVDGSSISANWQEGGAAVTGLGTDITGVDGATNGFDASGSNNASMFTFHNVNRTWDPVTNTLTTNLEAGTPYRILVRGDRTVDQSVNAATPTNTTLRSTGTIVTGNVVVTDFSADAGDLNFVGNPYQAPVNMTAALAAASNLNTTFYTVWDPTLGGAPVVGVAGGRGAYVTVDLIEDDNSNPASVANKYLQPNQAAFVGTLAAGAATLTFNEAHKDLLTNTTPLLYKNANNQPSAKIKLQLFDSNSMALNETSADGLVIRFSDEFSDEVDALDAVKMTNQDENVAVLNGVKKLSIERRSMPEVDEVIQLFNSQYRKTNYTYSVAVEALEDVTAYLLDNYTEELTELANNGQTTYNFTVNPDDAASIDANRFAIVFEETPLGNEDFTAASGVSIYPNPAAGSEFFVHLSSGADNAVITVYNALGQKVLSSFDKQATNTLSVKAHTQMAAGVYMVQIEKEGRTVTKKLIIK